ncbi:MAG: hypothetical protein ACE5GW_13065, partial [Planctomycetota bacterium]
RYIEGARHVEVQVLGDGAGGALSLGERDCSIQRRHQKLIEESPAPRLDDRKREELAQSARRLIEKSRYRGAGTVEFILAPDGAFYFLEMNTRLQVEHPVTEMIYGIDLVALQVAIARGQGWPSALAEARPRGHAIEARIYAESPAAGFLPSTGVLAEAAWPEGPGVRVDAGVERGSEVGVHYDPLLGKIIAHGGSRDEALERLRAALAETFLAGIDTTVGFSRDLLDSAGFRDGQVHTTFIEERMKDWSPPPAEDGWEAALNAAALQLFEQGAAGGNSGGSAGKGPPAVWEALGGWRMDR